MELLTGLQFDICYVIKTRLGFGIPEITRFLNHFSSYSFALWLLINVYKTVKCEVINVGFLSKHLPLNNSAITFKWKCLNFLYSSKGMCRIDSQLKKNLIRLRFTSWSTICLFLYTQLVFWFYTHLALYHLCFQVLPTTTFPFLAFPNFPFLCLFLQL